MFLLWLLTIIVQVVCSSSNCSMIMTFFVRQCLLHIMCVVYIAQNHRVKHIVCNMFFLLCNSSCLWIEHHLPFFTIYLSKKEKKEKEKVDASCSMWKNIYHESKNWLPRTKNWTKNALSRERCFKDASKI